jgi:hypothetical protein
MIEGRKEKRNQQRLQVLLSSLAQPLRAEPASAEDANSFGMRVQTLRPWELGTIVLLKSPQDELLARARVVYCTSLPSKTFRLGLEFLSRTDAWPER